MCSLRLIALSVLCLICVGLGWAESTHVQSPSVSSRQFASPSLSESATESQTSSPERSKTQALTSRTETITNTQTDTSTVDAAASTPSQSDVSTEDNSLSSLVESEKTSTRTIARTSSISLTTVHSSATSENTPTTWASQSNNDTTTTLPGFTTNSSSSATATRINSTVPGVTSPLSNATSSAGVYHQPGHCLVGSDCAWKLGVGLSFGGTFALAVLFFVSQRYRRHLVASHREHQNNWNSRGHILDEYGYPRERHEVMKMVDTPDTRATSPHNGRFDELYLPDDVLRAVDQIAELQRQETRLPVESFGSVKRKPLPACAH